MGEGAQEQSDMELQATIDRMVEVVKRINELSAFGIIGITSRGVHLSCDVFKKRFGLGRNILRELKGASGSSIRCSVIYNGVEFCSWWDVPSGLKIIDNNNREVKCVDIYDVELVK